EARGVERRSRLGEAHDGFRIEAMAVSDGETRIEGIAAATGAFDRDIEGRDVETRTLRIVIVGAVGSTREDAGFDATIEEIFGVVAQSRQTGERRSLLDRGHEIIDMR